MSAFRPGRRAALAATGALLLAAVGCGRESPNPGRTDGGDRRPPRPTLGHNPAAREEIERCELLQRDQRLALRDDESGDAELKPPRAPRKEAERHQCLGNRSVRAGMLGRNDQVVGDPPGLEARLLGSDSGTRERLGVERRPVVTCGRYRLGPNALRGANQLQTASFSCVARPQTNI
jgi:hypothetical protein